MFFRRHRDRERLRFEFRIGDVFDPDDRLARYLVRLSIALGDLRIAGATYLVREDQPLHERMYFMRLTATHLHELAILFNPPNTAIPTIEEFITAVIAPDDSETADTLRSDYRRVQRMLSDVVNVPGRPRLASELKRLRNDYAHYFNNEADDARLIDAMRLAAGLESSYVIREETMRAEYADEISNKLMHPWPDLTDEEWLEAVRRLHVRVRSLKPVAAFLHQAEAAYVTAYPEDVVRIIRPRRTVFQRLVRRERSRIGWC